MPKLYYIEGLTRKELFLDDILIAGAASIITKTLLAPSERIHLIMVNQNEIFKRGLIKRPFRNFLDCAVKTARYEGVCSFWRGNLVNCLAHFPSPTLNLTFKDELKISFNSTVNDTVPLRLCKNMTSGCIAGVITLCFIYPLELVKSKLAFDIKSYRNSNKNQYKGLRDVYRSIVREKGYAGLYRGFLPSCLSTFIYRGFYFGLYDTFKPELLGESPSLASMFTLGYFVSIFSGFMSYPVDTIKRRMAIEIQTNPDSKLYKNSWDCFKKILKKEGPKSLMRGSSAHFLRALDGAGFLMGFDELVYIIIEKNRR